LKPPAFAYHDPRTLDRALELLADHAADGKVLAGGQSLVPLLNFRLASPAHLIDLNRIGELFGIRRRQGSLWVGAMTRQSMLERSTLVREGWPLLTEAVGQVAHAAVRNRGTVGGSVAHADPAAELPVALSALDAVFHARSPRGPRSLASSEFFVGHLTTALQPDELLVEIEVPTSPDRTGHCFAEFARRHGDFALGGAAALVTLGPDGVCTRTAIALLAAGPTPGRVPEAEGLLVGKRIVPEVAAAVAEEAVAGIAPTGDIHGSTDYRRHLIKALTRRAVMTAAARAASDDRSDGSYNQASAR